MDGLRNWIGIGKNIEICRAWKGRTDIVWYDSLFLIDH